MAIDKVSFPGIKLESEAPLFDYMEKEASNIPQQVERKKGHSICYYTASILSLGLVPLIHVSLSKLAPRLILPSTSISRKEKRELDSLRDGFLKSGNPCHNFKVQTQDKAKVDGMLVFNSQETKNTFMKSPAQGQKWIVCFNGNGEYYEKKLDFAQSLGNKTKSNVLVYNYRNTGNSEGPEKSKLSDLKPEDLIRDGEACIKYLLAQGVKEEDILVFGTSLGGGVAAQVATLHKNIGFVHYNSFSRLSDVIKENVGVLAAKIVKGFGWEFDTVKAWKELPNKKLSVLHEKDQVISYKVASLYKVLKKEAKALPDYDKVKFNMSFVKFKDEISRIRHKDRNEASIDGIYIYQEQGIEQKQTSEQKQTIDKTQGKKQLIDKMKLQKIANLASELELIRMHLLRLQINNITAELPFQMDISEIGLAANSQEGAAKLLELVENELTEIKQIDISAINNVYGPILGKDTDRKALFDQCKNSLENFSLKIEKALAEEVNIKNYKIKKINPHNVPLIYQGELLYDDAKKVVGFINDFFGHKKEEGPLILS